MATDKLPNSTQMGSVVTALQTIAQKSQTPYNSDNKLPTDYADDTNQTHKFATQAQLTQIETNRTNILSLQTLTQGIDGSGNDFIEINGIKLFVSSTAPTSGMAEGDVGIGW